MFLKLQAYWLLGLQIAANSLYSSHQCQMDQISCGFSIFYHHFVDDY